MGNENKGIQNALEPYKEVCDNGVMYVLLLQQLHSNLKRDPGQSDQMNFPLAEIVAGS